MDKSKILIFLSLLFWVQVCVITVLGVKVLFFNKPVEVGEKTTTPAEIRGKM